MVKLKLDHFLLYQDREGFLIGIFHFRLTCDEILHKKLIWIIEICNPIGYFELHQIHHVIMLLK
jgi:hypothetical protein